MGKYKQLLAEEADLAKVVGKIKQDVMQFRKMQERDEAQFRKELDMVEGKARKALEDFSRLYERHKDVFASMSDSKYEGHLDERLRENVGMVAENIPAIAAFLAGQADDAEAETATAAATDEPDAGSVADPEPEDQ